MRVFHRDEQEARSEDAVVPPLEPQPFVTEEGREIERLRAELAAAIKQRDEAHGLICAWWRKNAIDLVDDGESMYAMTPAGQRAMMNDADKRAFLAATAKEGGAA